MITSLVIDIAITIVGKMSDSSFEDSVEDSVLCAFTASHLTLKCLCGYPPDMRRVSIRYKSLALPFVFDHKLGPWLDWFCIRSRVETSSLVPCNIVGVATPDYTTLWLRARFGWIN